MSPSRIFIARLELPVHPMMVRSAVDCASRVGEALSFGEADRYNLEVAVEEAVSNAVKHFSRPADADERVHVEFCVQEGSLVVSIRENGIPFDSNQADRYTPDTIEGMNFPGLGMLLMHEGMDSVELFVHGRAGKETRMSKKLKFGALPEALLQADTKRPLRRALVENVVVRPATRDDLGEIRRLAWKCYGYTQEELLYDFDLLTEKFLAGDYRPFVAFDADGGEMIAHAAFKYHDRASGVPELGLGFIDPARRSPGLSARITGAMLDASREAGDRGVFDCSVTTHVASQRIMQEYCGSAPCALLMGIAPAGMQVKYLPVTKQEKGTVLNHYKAFDTSAATVYPSPRHREMTAEIYEWIGLPRTFGEPDAASPPAGESSVSVFPLPEELNISFVVVHRIGEATAREVAAAARRCRRERKDAVYAFLPLGVESSPHMVEQCERIGFSFAGVMPHVHDGDDRILMQRVDVPLDAGKIMIYGERARRLFSYVVEEQRRIEGVPGFD